MQNSPPGAILVIGPSWVGDMVMAQPLFSCLKQHNPDVAIDVLAPGWSLPIMERMPEIRRGISMPLGHGQFDPGLRYRLGKSLRGQYQQAIILPNSFKSALIPLFAKIPKRTGWRGEMRYGLLNDLRILDPAKLALMVQRFVSLAFPANASLPENILQPSLTVSEEAFALLEDAHHLGAASQPVLALCPGAEFGDAKQWPAEHYARVAETKINEGWKVWILGSRNDGPVARDIRQALPETAREQCINLTGHTQLVDAIDLLAHASAVVTNDSGLMHVAAAVKTPLVAIYGSTSPDFTPPLGEKQAIITSTLDCAPCFKRTCPLKHKNCLMQQTPDVILQHLNKLVS
jgi:heptosyltransferase-2